MSLVCRKVMADRRGLRLHITVPQATPPTIASRRPGHRSGGDHFIPARVSIGITVEFMMTRSREYRRLGLRSAGPARITRQAYMPVDLIGTAMILQ